MRLEEFVEKLQEIKDRHGNKRVCISTEDGNLEVRRIISNIAGIFNRIEYLKILLLSLNFFKYRFIALDANFNSQINSTFNYNFYLIVG